MILKRFKNNAVNEDKYIYYVVGGTSYVGFGKTV